MSYSTLTLAEVGTSLWNTFVDNTSGAWLWHRTEYLSACTTWPGVVDLSFAVMCSSRGMVGIFPLHRREAQGDPTTYFRELISRGGLCVRDDISSEERAAVSCFLLESMCRLARLHRSFHVEITLLPRPLIQQGPRDIENHLSKFGFSASPTATWIVNLNQSIESIREGFSYSVKHNLKQIALTRVKIVGGRPEDAKRYFQLHKATFARSAKPAQPTTYFEHIFRECIPAKLCRVLFAAIDDRFVAANITATYKNLSLYWMGASLRTRESRGVNSLLMASQIELSHQENHSVYETGETYLGQTDVKQKGMSDFKRRFGGQQHDYYRGELELNLSRFLARRVIRAVLRR